MSRRLRISPPMRAGFETLRKSDDYRPPATEGEQRNDRPSQAADRARQAHKELLQRKLQFLQSKLEEAWMVADEAAERRLSAQIESTLLELDMVKGTTNVLKGDAIDRLEARVASGLRKAAEHQPKQMADSYMAGLAKEDEAIQKAEIDLSDPLGLRGDAFGVWR